MSAIFSNSPSQSFRKWFDRIPRVMRFTFVATFVSGLLIHLFFLTNLDLNQDTWSFSGGMMWEAASLVNSTITSGRWFQTYVDMVNGLPFVPWVMGLVCLFSLSLVAAVLVHLLRIKRCLCALLIALAMASFPSVATSLVYHSTGSYITWLLVVLSVLFTRRFRFGFLIGSILIMLSLAVYQAYIFAASSLFVILMILDIIDGEKTVKHVFIGGCKAVLSIGLGYVAYSLVLKCVLHYTGLQLTDYRGINQMHTLGIDDLWHSLNVIYGAYFNVFERSYDRMLASVMPWIILITGTLAVITLIWLGLRKRLWRQPLKICLMLVLLIIFPIAVNGIYIISALGASVYSLMLMPCVMSSVFCIALLSRFEDTIRNLPSITSSQRLVVATCWLQITLLLFAFYGNFLYTNEAYMKHDLAIRQATVFTEGLYRDILDTPGYTESMLIYRIGKYTSSLNIDPQYDIRTNSLYGFLTKDEIVNGYNYAGFAAAYIGESLRFVAYVDDGILAPYEDIIDEMTIYPAEGAIRVVDGIVLFKFGESK